MVSEGIELEAILRSQADTRQTSSEARHSWNSVSRGLRARSHEQSATQPLPLQSCQTQGTFDFEGHNFNPRLVVAVYAQFAVHTQPELAGIDLSESQKLKQT